MMLLNASGLETADNKAFIKQPLEQLIKKLPSYVPKVAKVVADVANKATEVLGHLCASCPPLSEL
jgi:c-di-GMP-related signal transduction protein